MNGISDDISLLCWVFCSAAAVMVVLLCVALWDFLGWKLGKKRTTLGGKKGQGGPFTL